MHLFTQPSLKTHMSFSGRPNFEVFRRTLTGQTLGVYRDLSGWRFSRLFVRNTQKNSFFTDSPFQQQVDFRRSFSTTSAVFDVKLCR